jgi:hypothetical protein
MPPAGCRRQDTVRFVAIRPSMAISYGSSQVAAMEADRYSVLTKQQFDAVCRARVPAIIAALQGCIVQQYVYKAVAAKDMPTWVNDTLFGVFRPRPVAAPAVYRKRRPRT